MNDFDLNLSERRVMASGTEIPVINTGTTWRFVVQRQQFDSLPGICSA